MKKVITLFMSILLVFTLAACGNQGGGNDSQTSRLANDSDNAESVQESSGLSGKAADETVADASEDIDTEQELTDADTGREPTGADTEQELTGADTEQEPAEESGKILVVYFSASGNTKTVAEYIAKAADADSLELVPAEPYSDADLDWTTEGSRVNREHEDESLRETELVETTVSDWDSYDTVFIGFPIWWGIAAWPVNGFVEANDFTGKTVIPFCTSTSSGLGESGELLAEAAGTGNWLEGQRFSSGASEEDVQTWINSLAVQ